METQRTQEAGSLGADARADSLLSLPADSLRSADAAWLAAYAARRTTPAERERERGKTVFAVLGIGALIGVAAALWMLQSASVGS